MSDACIAAQNAVIAAESLGLGSCYIGDILENCELHREMLNLPECVVPACMLVFGYPTEAQKARRKPARFEEKYIVHENGYRDLTDAELREMWERCGRAENGVQTFEAALRAFCARKYNSDFSREYEPLRPRLPAGLRTGGLTLSFRPTSAISRLYIAPQTAYNISRVG